jgi:hypothetical protein
MHNAAYEACGMRYQYEAMSSSNIDDLKTLTQAQNFGGTAITQPFKTTALELMSGLSPHAKVIGAVNTIVPVRELFADGSMPDELDIISNRNQQGPVKALYGFNTGIWTETSKTLRLANNCCRLDWYPRLHSTRAVAGQHYQASNDSIGVWCRRHGAIGHLLVDLAWSPSDIRLQSNAQQGNSFGATLQRVDCEWADPGDATGKRSTDKDPSARDFRK